MTSREDQFAKELKAAFRAEAREQIQRITTGLLELEDGNVDAGRKGAIVEAIYREAHNLKGSARATDYLGIESVCQEMEGIFSLFKQRQMDVSENVLELLLAALDAVAAVLKSEKDEIEQTDAEQLAMLALHLQKLHQTSGKDVEGENSREQDAEVLSLSQAASQSESIDIIDESSGGATAAAKSQNADMALKRGESIRVSAADLDRLLLQAQEMLSFKTLLKQHCTEISSLMAFIDPVNTEWTQLFPYMGKAQSMLESNASEVERAQVVPFLSRILDYTRSNHERVLAVQEKLSLVSRSLTNDDRYAAAAVDSLLADTKRLLMLPCSTILDVFPRQVRDLAKELGKEIDLSITGTDVKLDKRILAKINDPLMHLVRNSIDHGIETPDQRLKSGKPRRGSIKIKVRQLEAGLNEIDITDDGAGINLDRVKDMAIVGKFISDEGAEDLSKSELISLIFKSSLSTSHIITEISGRGLGMAIAKDNITQLGGRLEVHTEAGTGTTFKLLLPSTIASFRGIVVRSDDQLFVLPTVNVEQVIRLNRRDVKRVENCDTISYGNTFIPLISLAEVLNIAGGDGAKRLSSVRVLFAAIVNASGTRIAFTVDEIVMEQDLLVKPLSKPLLRVHNISGATVLASGEVIAVLNVADLIRSAQKHSVSSSLSAENADEKEARKKILVVDDTITTRMLLKNILESAGYQITVANDGRQALGLLREEGFDLVVSDVEMPNINGFELTKQIRQEKTFSQTPVVLVTTLASKEDREKGVACGADAYFVKSKFDQSNLLDVIQRLLHNE